MIELTGRVMFTGQDACCAAVRRLLSRRTRERIEVADRPDVAERRLPAVEEIWTSPTVGYAVEHTRVEAFERQIRDDANFMKLVSPIEVALTDRIPGRFTMALPIGAASSRRLGLREAQVEIAKLVLDASGGMADGETVTLRSDALGYEIKLHKRHSGESRLLAARIWTADDSERQRAERIRRALEAKLPKLRDAAAALGYRSVLVLESNDIALSNAIEVGQAFKVAIEGVTNLADLVFLAETDASPITVWVLKDGDRILPHEPYYQDFNGGAED